MSTPCIISVAITGSLPKKKDNPAVPITAAEQTLAKWSLKLGGDCRTGLEDNVRLDRETLAPSNAALVRQVVALCEACGRRPATVEEARRLLHLPAAARPAAIAA